MDKKRITSKRFEEFCNEIESIYSLARGIVYGIKSESAFMPYGSCMRDYADIQIVFARFRRRLPEHYKDIIEIHQDIIDNKVAPVLDIMERPSFTVTMRAET